MSHFKSAIDQNRSSQFLKGLLQCFFMKEAFLGITSPCNIKHTFSIQKRFLSPKLSLIQQLPNEYNIISTYYYTHTQLNPSLNFEKMCSIITMRKNICNLFALPFLSQQLNQGKYNYLSKKPTLTLAKQSFFTS